MWGVILHLPVLNTLYILFVQLLQFIELDCIIAQIAGKCKMTLHIFMVSYPCSKIMRVKLL